MTRPQCQASLFKISHHGSVTADHSQVWSLMLKPEPLAALTPFAAGNVFLPTKVDIDRIYTKTKISFLTGIPKLQVTKGRFKLVEKQIKEMGVKIRQVHFSIGQVRTRGSFIDYNLNWTVELFGGAVPLNEIYQ